MTAPLPVIVALDDMDESTAIALARQLEGQVWGFKAHELIHRLGGAIIGRLRQYGHVFADMKLHDIPNTVAHMVEVLEQAGASIINMHIAGGLEMMQRARQACRGEAKLLAFRC